MGANAAKDAARTQADAAREANILLAALYDQQRQDLGPYREAGYTALARLGELAQAPVAYERFRAPAPMGATFRPPYAG
jgi:hypothetical protein